MLSALKFGNWLPGDRYHPPRPDLPVLRHLNWREIHAMQLGGGFGILVYWGQALGQEGVVFSLALIVARIILGERNKRSENNKCEHNLGFHDVRGEPWYFVVTSVLLWAGFSAVAGVPEGAVTVV